MTGGEVAAAATAAAGIVKKAADKDSSKARLARIAEESDMLLPAADAYARRVALKQNLLLQLYRPFGWLVGVSREYFAFDFGNDMADKIVDIPEEDLVTPPATVAVPAMLALSYSLDAPDLKEMYLNLLAAASDGRRTSDVHPSFAEVIKQLAPAEAQALRSVLVMPEVEMVRVTTSLSGGGFRMIYNNLINWHEGDPMAPTEHPSMEMYIDNWIRLGLVEANYGRMLITPNAYSWVVDRPEYKRVQDEVAALTPPEDPTGQSWPTAVGWDSGFLRRTAFGERFARAVSIIWSDVEVDGAG
jgi:hypothetical protein